MRSDRRTRTWKFVRASSALNGRGNTCVDGSSTGAGTFANPCDPISPSRRVGATGLCQCLLRGLTGKASGTLSMTLLLVSSVFQTVPGDDRRLSGKGFSGYQKGQRPGAMSAWGGVKRSPRVGVNQITKSQRGVPILMVSQRLFRVAPLGLFDSAVSVPGASQATPQAGIGSGLWP